MNSEAQIFLTLLLYNLKLRSHTSSLPVDVSFLLYFIMTDGRVDIAQIISQEIKSVASSSPVLGAKPSTQLTYSGLITGLCCRVGVDISDMVHLPLQALWMMGMWLGTVFRGLWGQECLNLRPWLL